MGEEGAGLWKLGVKNGKNGQKRTCLQWAAGGCVCSDAYTLLKSNTIYLWYIPPPDGLVYHEGWRTTSQNRFRREL